MSQLGRILGIIFFASTAFGSYGCSKLPNTETARSYDAAGNLTPGPATPAQPEGKRVKFP
jgi:hypothetical protein